MSDIPSSGGLLRATSLEISPVVLFAADALVLGPLPKMPDIFKRQTERRSEEREGKEREESGRLKLFNSCVVAKRVLLGGVKAELPLEPRRP